MARTAARSPGRAATALSRARHQPHGRLPRRACGLVNSSNSGTRTAVAGEDGVFRSTTSTGPLDLVIDAGKEFEGARVDLHRRLDADGRPLYRRLSPRPTQRSPAYQGSARPLRQGEGRRARATPPGRVAPDEASSSTRVGLAQNELGSSHARRPAHRARSYAAAAKALPTTPRQLNTDGADAEEGLRRSREAAPARAEKNRQVRPGHMYLGRRAHRPQTGRGRARVAAGGQTRRRQDGVAHKYLAALLAQA